MSASKIVENATLPWQEFPTLDLFHGDKHKAFFKKQREENPVFLCRNHPFYGSFWNVTRYEDIAYVDTHHDIFSSEGSILIEDQDDDFPLPMFIAMDRPDHTKYRESVAPAFSSGVMNEFASLIQSRTEQTLDALPIGQAFDWVEKVSVELTSQMLATLFGFPFEHRHQLIRWSNFATMTDEDVNAPDFSQRRQSELMACLKAFTELKAQKRGQSQSGELISMLAHSPHTQSMMPSELLGNVVLLLVAGNDTTRNSMTGGVYALNQFPEQYALLKQDPSRVEQLVPEIIRWQTPLAYMRRTAKTDTQLGGKTIRAGEKVVMWYASGNCDESVFTNGDALDITRDRAQLQKHLAFGTGIHRCIGKRLAELQLKILWQQLLERFSDIEVVAPVSWINSNFVKGYSSMQVVLHK